MRLGWLGASLLVCCACSGDGSNGGDIRPDASDATTDTDISDAHGDAGGSGAAGSGGLGGASGSAGGGGTGGSAGSDAGLCGLPPGPTADSQADCAGYCAKLAQAACSNEPSEQDCTDECAADARFIAPDCEAEMVALTQCVVTQATISCDANGAARISGCDAQQQAFEGCAACIPVPSDDACSCCEAASCCAESKELVLDPSFWAYLECRTTCGPNPGCWEGCGAQYPQTEVKFDAYNFCINGACAVPCFGG